MDSCKFENCASRNELNAISIFIASLSISGSTATIYAYLGEFHNNKYRDRAIMACSALFGVSCMLLPLVVWYDISTTLKF